MAEHTLVKICGLTKTFEAGYLNEAKADYAGMVLFFPKSKRNISIEQAKEIMSGLDASIKKVAVVVKPSLEQVQQIEAAGFDLVQIHGMICEEILQKTKIPIWKAFNVSDMEAFERYQKEDRITGYVFDAAKPGSGETFDWRLMDQIPRDEKTLMLAGGLNADNVGEAIAYLKPDGVDVSSSVEMEGKQEKDPEKIKAFVKMSHCSE
jgi:phosphoribosylanthranilate isomerase